MGEVNQGRKVLHIYCDDLLERCALLLLLLACRVVCREC